jgi:hypothetical protein
MKYIVAITLILLCTSQMSAQVDEIKNASRSSGRGGGGSESSSSSSFAIDFFFNFMLGGIVDAQRAKLERRSDMPNMVSLDVMLQNAVQPSSYYIINPRIRGNWGLFSTDFRINYLIEEGFDEYKHIRTNEWQVLQFNIITTKDVVFRVGGGFLQESFGGYNYYGEWTTALQVHPSQSKLGGLIEYRDANARKEVNGYLRYHIFDHNALHGFVTGGAVYQRYYDTISVWGMQAGIIVSLY